MRQQHSLRAFSAASCLFLLAAMCFLAFSAVAMADVVLRGGMICDGSGVPARAGDVVLRDGRIAAIGPARPQAGDRVIDCTGLLITPGFIDVHTHSDGTMGTPEGRAALNYLRQGCTTMVTGNCGGGAAEIAKFLDNVDRQGAGCNIAHLIPHGGVRRTAMRSERRAPTPEELQKMEALVDQGMREGAWGMSTGLIYPPSSYAQIDEIMALAKVVARHGGIYATHIRNEGEGLLDAVREAIDVGQRSGAAVQISHFKVMGIPNWGLVRQAAGMIEQARTQGVRITADQYPYTASSTSMASTVIPDDKIPGGRAKLAARMEADANFKAQVRELIAARIKRSTKIVIAQSKKHPQYAGKSVQQIAEEEKLEPVDVALKLSDVSVVNHAMSEEDVRWVMQLPWVLTASDGSARGVKPEQVPHPRNFGTFARKIGRYAIEDKVLDLATAVRSASGLPADTFGIPDRGYLRTGAVADVVVLDPKTYRDTATFDNPQQYAQGVRWVFVAGQAAIDDGQPSDKLYGRALRHASAAK